MKNHFETKRYSKSFHFRIEEEQFKKDGHLKVALNSNNQLDLKLCLQKNRKLASPSKPCDITGHSLVEISNEGDNLNYGTDWAISVIYSPEKHAKIPLEFSLLVFQGNDSNTHLKILNPGRTFSSSIRKSESVIVKINLLSVSRSSLIILTSEDKSVRGVVSLNKYDFSKKK